MKYLMFYNKAAISIFKEIKNGFELKILKGINKECEERRINIFHSKKFIEFSFKTGFHSKAKKQFKNIYAKDENREYILEGLHVDICSFDTLKGTIDAVKSKSFSTSSSYYKLLIPIKPKFNFHWTIEELIFSSDRVSVSRLGTKIESYGEEIFILIESDEEKNSYLVIESRKKQSYKEFSEKTHLIKIAIGYLTGYYMGNEGCYFSYSNNSMERLKGFKFMYMRPEIRLLTQPVYSNPYGWTKNKKVADRYYMQGILKPIPQAVLSCLFMKMVEYEDFASALLLILESTESSLIVRPNGYAIALETLSDLIVGTRKDKLAPITNKSESKKFRKELSDVLARYSQNEHFQDIATLQGRIDQINQMTNREKLKAPFKILNILLSDEDIKVISSRNDFLHGRVPDFKNLGPERPVEQKDSDLYYASVRLYTLLNMLILKFVGFDGYIVNYSKIYEKGTGYPCKEDFYRSI